MAAPERNMAWGPKVSYRKRPMVGVTAKAMELAAPNRPMASTIKSSGALSAATIGGTGKNTPWVKPHSTRRTNSAVRSSVKQNIAAFRAYRPLPSTSSFFRPTLSMRGATAALVTIPSRVRPVIIMPVHVLVPPRSSTYTGSREIKMLLG